MLCPNCYMKIFPLGREGPNIFTHLFIEKIKEKTLSLLNTLNSFLANVLSQLLHKNAWRKGGMGVIKTFLLIYLKRI